MFYLCLRKDYSHKVRRKESILWVYGLLVSAHEMTDVTSQHTSIQISSSYTSIKLYERQNVELFLFVNTIKNLVTHFILVCWSFKTEKLTTSYTSVVRIFSESIIALYKLWTVRARHIISQQKRGISLTLPLPRSSWPLPQRFSSITLEKIS